MGRVAGFMCVSVCLGGGGRAGGLVEKKASDQTFIEINVCEQTPM